MKEQGSIYCVVVEPNKHAVARHVEYEYSYSSPASKAGAKDLAEFEKLKQIIGTDMGEFLNYPTVYSHPDPKIYVLGDEEGRLRPDAKQNRGGYFGTIIVVGRGSQFADTISLTREQAEEVLAVMNKGMPPQDQEGNRRR